MKSFALAVATLAGSAVATKELEQEACKALPVGLELKRRDGGREAASTVCNGIFFNSIQNTYKHGFVDAFPANTAELDKFCPPENPNDFCKTGNVLELKKLMAEYGEVNAVAATPPDAGDKKQSQSLKPNVDKMLSAAKDALKAEQRKVTDVELLRFGAEPLQTWTYSANVAKLEYNDDKHRKIWKDACPVNAPVNDVVDPTKLPHALVEKDDDKIKSSSLTLQLSHAPDTVTIGDRTYRVGIFNYDGHQVLQYGSRVFFDRGDGYEPEEVLLSWRWRNGCVAWTWAIFSVFFFFVVIMVFLAFCCAGRRRRAQDRDSTVSSSKKTVRGEKKPLVKKSRAQEEV